jgi:hypothetical protein
MTLRVFDRGPEPEWHKDRRYWGPWQPFEAEIALGEDVFASEIGSSAHDAILRVVSAQRDVLQQTH